MGSGESSTKRKIGLFYGVIAGLGSTLGIEFLLLIDYAAQLAGPAIVLSLIISGFINLIIMFNYAELSASISRIGAEYTFTKAAFGGFTCFLSGWLRWLSSVFTTTLSAVGLARVINLLIPQVNPSLIAVIAISLFTMISIKGGKTVDLVAVLSFILVFAVLGIVSTIQGLDFSNFQPFMPNGFYPGVLSGVMYTFSMYVGMRAIATQSPAMKEPGKVLPRAVWLSTLISIIIYSGVAFVAVGVVPLDTSTSDPLLIRLGEIVMGPLGEAIVMIAWISAALMSLATSMTVQTSIISALSRDGYLPRIVFSPDERSRNRYIIQMIGALLAILFAASGLIVFVGYAAGFASLMVYAIVNLSLVKLRKERPYLDRPFKTPLYPYTPIIGVLIALILMIFVEGSAIVLVLEFVMILLIAYHLRMMGYYRLRLAIAGINLGVSALIALILSLIRTGIVKFELYAQDQTAFFTIGSILVATFFIAGILNLVKSEKEEIEIIERQWME